jgi:hypothetical protein
MNKIRSLIIGCIALSATSCTESPPLKGLGEISYSKLVQDLYACQHVASGDISSKLISMEVCKEQLQKPTFYFDCEKQGVRLYRDDSVPSLIHKNERISKIWKAIDIHYKTSGGYQNWISSMPKVLKTAGNRDQTKAEMLPYVDSCPTG